MYYIPLQQPLDPAFMDGLLELGWYRMSQSVFTTPYIYLSETEVYEALWARIVLSKWQPSKTQVQLQKRNARFTLRVEPFRVDDEIEYLYRLYRNAIDFGVSDSARSYLMDQQSVNFFPTKTWTLFDGNELIAVSYFDEGVLANAGILTFFHPAYKKYSPGLYLYLESVRLAKEQGKEFFYPGYIAMHNPKFDYKLKAGKDYMEIWNQTEMKWQRYANSKHALMSILST
jgi:arginine-tRNA-protein transferase